VKIGALISGQCIEVLHIVSGGTQNELLNQFTVNATGLQVVTGPIKTTVSGSAAGQLIVRGELGSIAQVRQVIVCMGVTKTYQPQHSWTDVFQRIKL
jgi:rhamnulokinase